LAKFTIRVIFSAKNREPFLSTAIWNDLLANIVEILSCLLPCPLQGGRDIYIPAPRATALCAFALG